METKNSKEKIKIMIADDFPLLLEDMCELIDRQEDMEVVGTAGSGKKIVELAKETKFKCRDYCHGAAEGAAWRCQCYFSDSA